MRVAVWRRVLEEEVLLEFQGFSRGVTIPTRLEGREVGVIVCRIQRSGGGEGRDVTNAYIQTYNLRFAELSMA